MGRFLKICALSGAVWVASIFVSSQFDSRALGFGSMVAFVVVCAGLVRLGRTRARRDGHPALFVVFWLLFTPMAVKAVSPDGPSPTTWATLTRGKQPA